MRRPHMQIPTLDEMNAKLNGAAFFTTLDCQGGFHQIPIAKTSQLLLTFSIHLLADIAINDCLLGLYLSLKSTKKA